jgi:hypothetical protein
MVGEVLISCLVESSTAELRDVFPEVVVVCTLLGPKV